jgi:hypothetical protein
MGLLFGPRCAPSRPRNESRPRNPRYAPEFLERRLSPSQLDLIPVAVEVASGSNADFPELPPSSPNPPGLPPVVNPPSDPSLPPLPLPFPPIGPVVPG